MTVYELAISLPPEARKMLAKAGILAPNIERNIYVYELFKGCIDAGVPKMEAYLEVGRKCYISEDNLRKIIRKMSEEVGDW